MKERCELGAADSLSGGVTNALSQLAGSGLNPLTELVRELAEVAHDVLAYYPSSLVWRHRVEFFGRDQPGCVSHETSR